MATLNFLLSLSKPKQWLVTIAATAVSTYALDAVATAAGESSWSHQFCYAASTMYSSSCSSQAPTCCGGWDCA